MEFAIKIYRYGHMDILWIYEYFMDSWIYGDLDILCIHGYMDIWIFYGNMDIWIFYGYIDIWILYSLQNLEDYGYGLDMEYNFWMRWIMDWIWIAIHPVLYVYFSGLLGGIYSRILSKPRKFR